VPKPWAIAGVDLHVDVPPTRVRAGLETALRDAIRSGRLPTGTRLPSSRQLAADLGLARNTITQAYGQLVAERWLAAQPGSGTRVAHQPTATGEPPTPVATSRAVRYYLRAGLPNLAAFPATAWVTALRRALLAAPADTLGYSDPRGRPELRVALASYLARARGVYASSDRIVVCSRFTQALALLSQVLRNRGATTVAVEGYGQPAHRRVLTSHGLTISCLPVDGDGAQVGELDQQDAALLTPAHQFPLGPPLSPARRAAVVGWAANTEWLIVEDGNDGESRFDRHPVGALQVLAPDRSPTWARPARPSPPECGSGGWSPPANGWTTWSPPRPSPTPTAAASTSSLSPS